MEKKMFNNLTIEDGDLLINVEGCKERQRITTEDLIRKCKKKKTIVVRSWQEREANRRIKPTETITDGVLLHVKDNSTHKPGGQSTTAGTGHPPVPGQEEAQRVSIKLEDEIKHDE